MAQGDDRSGEFPVVAQKRSFLDWIFRPDAKGVATNVSKVFSVKKSGGNTIKGFNVMRFINEDGEYGDQHYYDFSNVKSQGIDIGMAGEGILAWGEGPWTGRFESFVFAFGPVTGSIFWTEDEEGGWKGFTYGVSWPVPAFARETTDYQEAPNTIGGGQ